MQMDREGVPLWLEALTTQTHFERACAWVKGAKWRMAVYFFCMYDEIVAGAGHG